MNTKNRCSSLTREMIKWLFSLAFPQPSTWLGRQAFEGWVATDQDEGYWQCRFCNAQKENGWKHEGSCMYAAVKRYLE